MTRDEIMLRVMHATPAELARLSAFVENGCKADAPADTHAPAQKLCTYPEAATMLRCSVQTVRRLHWEGQIEIAVIRNRQKVLVASVLAYIERKQTHAAPAA